MSWNVFTPDLDVAQACNASPKAVRCSQYPAFIQERPKSAGMGHGSTVARERQWDRPEFKSPWDGSLKQGSHCSLKYLTSVESSSMLQAPDSPRLSNLDIGNRAIGSMGHPDLHETAALPICSSSFSTGAKCPSTEVTMGIAQRH